MTEESQQTCEVDGFKVYYHDYGDNMVYLTTIPSPAFFNTWLEHPLKTPLTMAKPFTVSIKPKLEYGKDGKKVVHVDLQFLGYRR